MSGDRLWEGELPLLFNFQSNERKKLVIKMNGKDWTVISKVLSGKSFKEKMALQDCLVLILFIHSLS